jgi:DNA primase
MDNFSEMDLYDTLNELGLSYKNSSGSQLQLEKCPFCETDRPKPSDHFAFNRSEGVFNCVKCNHSGNLITFRRDLGLDPFKTKIYRTPDQKKVKTYQEQPPSYFKAYFEARGIPEHVLIKYGVGKAEYGELGTCRTYQYVDTDGTIVNVKYVNKNKEMRQEKDAKKIYYGLQFVDFTKDYLYITEGEDDCHAIVAMGYENVVSVPSGAKMYSEEMGIINSKFKKLYLFYDNDKAGQEGAEKFAQKAGVWKCFNVLLPFKDARDC